MASKRRVMERRDGGVSFRMRNALAVRLPRGHALVIDKPHRGVGKPKAAARLVKLRGRSHGR